jgi:hypothetical protein
MDAHDLGRRALRGSHGEPSAEAYERWWRDDDGVLQVRVGPAWVFTLWEAHEEARVTCAAVGSRGERCRAPVLQRLDPLTVNLSRYCARHRPPAEPVFRISAGYSDHTCPCGCGFRVLAYVVHAARTQQARRRHPLLALLWP